MGMRLPFIELKSLHATVRSGNVLGGLIFSVLCLMIFFFTAPLENVYYPQVFVVSRGETIRAIADDLREKNVINSPSLFIFSNYLLGEKILWGSYHFLEPSGVFFRARDLYTGARGMPLRKIVIAEGSNVYTIADIFEKEFERFNRDEFQEMALKQHGYLYPDTYLFAEDDISTANLIEIMTQTFKRRTDDLFETYKGDLSRDEIVTLASIVELEASRQQDRRKIAGVLFNRLEKGVPLQVDVSFLFISGKNTFKLRREDLETDDPSNTYKYTGIPPIPVTNPSREAIEAVMNPIKSNHLYFLADFYGNTYFSETYQEHLRKKEKYIDSVIRERKAKTNETLTE